MKKIILAILVFAITIPILFFFIRKNNILTYTEVVARCSTPNSHFYTWNDLQIHYVESGAGDETVLLLHGFGGSHKNFDAFSENLAKDYRVIAVDLPAFGLSEVPSLEMPSDSLFPLYQKFISDAIPLLGIEKYHLIGNSMGGWIAWDYAAKQDSNLLSLSLFNSAGFGMASVRSKISGWMTGGFSRAVLKKGVPMRVPKSNAERCLWDDNKVSKELVEQNYFMINKEGTFPFMLKMIESTVLPDTTALQNISTPTLIIWGENDEVVPVKYASKFEQAIPNSVKVVFENCGHVPQIEYPEIVANTWREFIVQK